VDLLIVELKKLITSIVCLS